MHLLAQRSSGGDLADSAEGPLRSGHSGNGRGRLLPRCNVGRARRRPTAAHPLRGWTRDPNEETAMPRFESSIDVDVPVRAVYDQWTQFEEFPQFMDHVERVDQLDDKRLLWVADIAGQRKEWTAEITDQTPDTRIAWRSTSGDQNDGAVLFESRGPNRTGVTLRIDADPKGPVETVGAALGFLQRAVEEDLKRFKEFIESRQEPTGAWRGEIHGQ